MTTIIAIVVITFVIFFGFGLISYAFNSSGLYNIAKKEDEKNAYIAWIPYINRYVLGKLAFKSSFHAILLTCLVVLELIVTLGVFFTKTNVQALYTFSITALVLSIITSIYTFIAHYNIYKKYSKSTVIMTILDVLSCGILGPFFIFAIRNNNENK